MLERNIAIVGDGATDRAILKKFYRAKARDGYTHEYLPVVIPVVTFPSTEIFIAAAKIDPKN